MHRVKYIYSLFYIILLLALTGCASKMTFIAHTDQSIDMDFSLALGKELSKMLSQSSNNGPIFSAEEIQSAFEDSDFKGIKVSSPSNDSLNITGTLNPSSTRYANGVKTSDFITCTYNSLTVRINTKSIQTLIKTLPEDASSYADIFMAPIFTGEAMSKQEYRDMIASVYGEDMAKTLDKSTIDIILAPPAGRKIAKTVFSDTNKAKATSSRAIISIEVLDFLSNTKDQSYSISW